MVMQVSFRFTTDTVTVRNIPTIMRETNRATGEWVRNQVTKSKFQKSAYSEFPGIVQQRSKKYRAWKMKKVGHDIPNKLTGLSEWMVPAGAYVTATSSGGRIRYKAPPHIGKWREAQRQEFEALSDRQRNRMAQIQETHATNLMKQERFRRKRRRKG
jgi:hypothetical protein